MNEQYGFHIEYTDDDLDTFHEWTYDHPTTASMVALRLMSDERIHAVTVTDSSGNRVQQLQRNEDAKDA